jgi:hypothetical protein
LLSNQYSGSHCHVAGSLPAVAAPGAEVDEPVVDGWVLAVGSLLVDPYDSPLAKEPRGLADNHLPTAGIGPSVVRSMLVSGVY